MDDIDEKQLNLWLEPRYTSGREIVIELQDKLDRQHHRHLDEWDVDCDQEKKPQWYKYEVIQNEFVNVDESCYYWSHDDDW